MKKLAILLAAVLATGFAAVAQPQGPPPGGFPGRQELSCKEKKEIGKATTEKMKSYLNLTEKQIRKLEKANRRFADVVGEEKAAKIGTAKPIYGNQSGPFYDTPGRPHPSGNNGVPGSWIKNQGPPPGFEAPEGQAPADFPADPSVVSRRSRYVKKLGKILSEEQFGHWKSRQLPFPGADV